MKYSLKRAELLMWVSHKLDYWTPRKDRCLEAKDQYDYYTTVMKFLVTKYEQAPMRERQTGTGLVFPSL